MNIPSFLIEIIDRWLSKTPKFFKILQRVSAVAATLMVLPKLINDIPGLHVPDPINNAITTIVTVAGYTVAFIAQLTVDAPKDEQK